ncbi:MAG: phenylalanine--tRNA ligase subunit beta [Candidatus Lightella neohaematopini]|nr:phenylalanine--tRNA ligase subunit beta [Candidatus Lightella neohaematopini]MCV2528882.1 phenylalanine--tRNA ligase subunit beta [Candidatus Lightella neohaematopini]
MIFSEFWLREISNLDININSLVNKLTISGFEVDSINLLINNNISGLIIGNVIEIVHLSNLNKSFLLKINLGYKIISIILDNIMINVNTKVVVAPVGATTFIHKCIKYVKINGLLSEGILCSFLDLGINEYGSNIIKLPYNAPIGSSIKKYLNLDDNIININIPFNRTDCYNVLGLSREILILNNIKLNLLNYYHSISPKVEDIIKITIKVPYICPVYLSRVIKNININKPLPIWLLERLRRVGIKLTFSILDIINYIFLELGYLVMIFDKDIVSDGIIIRKLKSTDNIDYTKVDFLPKDIVISNYRKILSYLELSNNINNTIDIVINCAFFNTLDNITYINKFTTHNNFNIIMGKLDYQLVKVVIEKTTELLIKVYGGIPGPITDITYNKLLPKTKKIILKKNKFYKITGIKISDHNVDNILCNIGCVINKNQSSWYVYTPSWRYDLLQEEDLIEELIRIYGFDNIYSNELNNNKYITLFKYKSLTLLDRTKILLVDKGYQEIISYSFIDKRLQNILYPNKKLIMLINPINTIMSSMRLSLLPGLIQTLIYNKNRQSQCIRLFESGFCFSYKENDINNNIIQYFMLSGLIYGNYSYKHWNLSNRLLDFYDIKGDLELIFSLIGIIDDVEFRVCNNLILHPGQSAHIFYKDSYVGLIGVIHPLIQKQLSLPNKILVFELLWDSINKFSKEKKFNLLSKYPVSYRELSIIISDDILSIDIIKECKKCIDTKLINVKIFDVYKGSNISKGYKSVTISIRIQNYSRNLREDEISSIVDKCFFKLKQKFGAYLR